EHHGDLDPDRQAGRAQPAAGRGLPEGSGAARQDRRRSEICQRSAESGFDADLLHQWRKDQGRDLDRGIREEDQSAAEELRIEGPGLALLSITRLYCPCGLRPRSWTGSGRQTTARGSLFAARACSTTQPPQKPWKSGRGRLPCDASDAIVGASE